MAEKLSCSICKRETEAGKEGILLLGKAICPACEEKILITPVSDYRYDEFIEKIRKIWTA